MRNKVDIKGSPYAIVSLVLLWALLASQPVMAQRDKVNNLPKFDNKKYHFGFTVGANQGDFAMEHDLSQTDSLVGLRTVPSGGFQLGIITDLHIGPYFNLRFVPILMFTERIVRYDFRGNDGDISTTDKRVESTYLEYPLLLKYRSKRLNNFASYVITGPKYVMDLASQQDVDNQFSSPNEILPKLKRDSWSYEVGFGFDFFLDYFKFSPELRFVVGLDNVHVPDGSDFSNPISRLNSRMFIISFNFEG